MSDTEQTTIIDPVIAGKDETEDVPEQQSQGENHVEEDDLSDLDEEQVAASEAQDEENVEEDVFKLQRHKKKNSGTSASEVPAKPKERTRERKDRTATVHTGDDDDYDNDDASSKNRKKRASEGADEIADEQLDPDTRRRREFERRIQSTGLPVNKRRKKTNDDVLDQFQDELINQLREKMRTAAIEDAECVRNGTPAMSKLRLLPEVQEVLRKGSLADTILDNNLLESIRTWLEPLPDASLPAYQIQKELFTALDRLPIKTIHLRESGLGKVVIFYQRSKRPQLNIKRIVDKLVGDWTRPIMGRSDNYRDKIVSSRTYNVKDDSAYQRRAPSAMASQANVQPGDLAEASALRRNRAHIPSASTSNYNVAPKSFVQNTQLSSQQRASNDENYKRMKMKLMSKKAATRKSGVSIEGR